MRSHPLRSRHPISVNVRRDRPQRRRFPLVRLILLLLLVGISVHQVRSLFQQPQAVLVLGGATDREIFAAQFARQRPDLPVWISSGSNIEYSEWVFTEAGVAPNRIHRDYEASDTVTNFTTLVDQFRARGITSVYLITSDYHMRRAWVIGEIVLGSRGIDFKTVAVPSEQPAESWDKTIRDAGRAILWVTTGNTGATLAKYFE